MKAMGLSRCQRQLLEELGDAYCANRIDGASCIYRDYGDHDVEICGGRTAVSKSMAVVKPSCTARSVKASPPSFSAAHAK